MGGASSLPSAPGRLRLDRLFAVTHTGLLPVCLLGGSQGGRGPRRDGSGQSKGQVGKAQGQPSGRGPEPLLGLVTFAPAHGSPQGPVFSWTVTQWRPVGICSHQPGPSLSGLSVRPAHSRCSLVPGGREEGQVPRAAGAVPARVAWSLPRDPPGLPGVLEAEPEPLTPDTQAPCGTDCSLPQPPA